MKNSTAANRFAVIGAGSWSISSIALLCFCWGLKFFVQPALQAGFCFIFWHLFLLQLCSDSAIADNNNHQSLNECPKDLIFKRKDMLTNINPKLPMRNKTATKDFYVNKLGFRNVGSSDYDGYLMVEKDSIEIHFFEFKEIDPKENYSGVYIRTNNIEKLYQSLLDNKISIHPNGALETKSWGQKEFALLDPDNNLLTFGQNI